MRWLIDLVLKKWLVEFVIVDLLDLRKINNWGSNLRSDVDGSFLDLLDLVLDELLSFWLTSSEGIGNWARFSLLFIGVIGGLRLGSKSLSLSGLLKLLEVDDGVEMLGVRVHMPEVLGSIQEKEEGV